MNKPSSQTAAAWPEKTFAAAPDAGHRAGQRISPCPQRTTRGQKSFLRKNSRFSQTDRERPRGRIVFRPPRQNAGDGFEWPRAFLRRPFDGMRHVRRARAGGVRHPRFAADERGGRNQ